MLRTNLTENDPALLWQYYVLLVAVEEAFKDLKGDLAIRPIFHQDERRVEAHILMRSRDGSVTLRARVGWPGERPASNYPT